MVLQLSDLPQWDIQDRSSKSASLKILPKQSSGKLPNINCPSMTRMKFILLISLYFRSKHRQIGLSFSWSISSRSSNKSSWWWGMWVNSETCLSLCSSYRIGPQLSKFISYYGNWPVEEYWNSGRTAIWAFKLQTQLRKPRESHKAQGSRITCLCLIQLLCKVRWTKKTTLTYVRSW